MSQRWRVILCVPALSIIVGTFSATIAVAQCQHGRQNSQMNPRMLQSVMQQQLRQQRLLLQVQQQQMLQVRLLENQLRELADKGPEAIKTALRDPKAERRWIAALVVGEQKLDLSDELIKLLSDSNPAVRQTARRSLVRLSTAVTANEGKPRSGRGIDFGPAPNANAAAQKIAARKWSAWFEKQKTQTVARKDIKSPLSAASAKAVPVKTTAKGSADSMD